MGFVLQLNFEDLKLLQKTISKAFIKMVIYYFFIEETKSLLASEKELSLPNNKSPTTIAPKDHPEITYKEYQFVCRRTFTTKDGQIKLTYRCKNCSTSFTKNKDGSIQEGRNFAHTCEKTTKRKNPSKLKNKDYQPLWTFINDGDENCLMYILSFSF